MQRPDIVDSRTVLRTYHVVAFAGGIALGVFGWPVPEAVLQVHVDRVSAGRMLMLLAGGVVWSSAPLAGRLATIEDPIARRGALKLLAIIVFSAGAVRWAPAWPLMRVVPPSLAAVPLVAGIVMLYLARAPRQQRAPGPAGAAVLRDKPAMAGRYEQSIRQAARQEERARLARELHDAVKQQLFVIQTAAATVEQRFSTDPAGAHTALAQVRDSARDALSEMEVMLEQLQAAPLSNAGLIESLKRQCEVLKFRTGADVQFTAAPLLPPEAALAPGAHQAMLRFAQEALANVARHARAKHVTVSLQRQQALLVLSVTDDGQGFDVTQPPHGMGLGNMGARAAEAEGTYAIANTPGTGTTVSLTIQPYAPDRSRYVGWIAASSAMMLGLLVPYVRQRWALVYVVAGLAICAAVLIDNARSWWRARQWP